MTTINNLSIEQMREAFERHQADFTGTDYKELKAHFDNNEQYFSSRYNEGSLYERDWFVWEACWQSRQAEVDFLSAQLGIKRDQIKSFESEIKKAWQAVEEKDKRIEEALFQMRQHAFSLKEDCDGYKDPVGICQSEGVDWCVRFLEKVLRGEHE